MQIHTRKERMMGIMLALHLLTWYWKPHDLSLSKCYLFFLMISNGFQIWSQHYFRLSQPPETMIWWSQLPMVKSLLHAGLETFSLIMIGSTTMVSMMGHETKALIKRSRENSKVREHSCTIYCWLLDCVLEGGCLCWLCISLLGTSTSRNIFVPGICSI